MEDQMFLVEASESEIRFVVSRVDLRRCIHDLFCMCGRSATCDNEYVSDFDDYSEEQILEGGHWDLEDGWVRYEPVRPPIATEEKHK